MIKILKNKEKKFIYISIFPSYFHNYFNLTLVKKALENNIIKYEVYNPRDFSRKGKIDDYPYGGGPGMLMKIEPIVKILKIIKDLYPKSCFILLSPQGKTFCQKEAEKMIKKFSQLVFICGRWEGIDSRINNYVDKTISLGNFVSMGGEIPSLLISEVLIRAIPGVINKISYQEESFQKKILDYDSYTRPRKFDNLFVPDVLLSGNHKEITKWRKKNIKEKLKTLKKIIK